ncbi:MAG: response regulator [Planctomycetota bacterium]
MKTKSASKRALVIASPEASQPALLESLEGVGVEYHLFEQPEEVLGVPAEQRIPFDVAFVHIEYPSMSGPELAWRLRRRYPTVPIIMLAEDLGTWDPSDIYDLGVNVLLERPNDPAALRSALLPVLGEVWADESEGAREEEFERLVAEATDRQAVPARIVNGRRIILYENAEMRELAGGNVGRNCFEFWGASSACADCLANASMEGARRLTRVTRTGSGSRMRVDAVPVVLSDGTPAAVEIFHLIDRK